MKKSIYLLLTFTLCSMENVSSQESYSLNYTYYSDERGDVATCFGRCSDSADVIIPPYVSYQGYNFKVIGLSEHAFDEDDGEPNYLRSISLPETLESIGHHAFSHCNKLQFIEIPKNVKEIGYSAFLACHSLKEAIVNCSGIFPLKQNNDRDQYSIFHWCSSLMTIYYTNAIAPQNWVATTRTYVPNKDAYSSPYRSITTTPHIIEMITFSESTFDYTGKIPNVSWTNNVEGYSASLDISALKTDAGTYIDTIPVTFTGEHPFVANIPYRYTIKPIKLTAKVNNCSRQFGDENPQFNISYSGFLNGDNESVITTQPSVATTATRTTDVGDYPIGISGGEAKNYEFVYESGLLTITKAPLSAKVCNTSKTYGEQNPAFTIEYFGLKNGETSPAWIDTPVISTNATATSDVGQYDITATRGVAKNYELSSISSGKLTVNPAPLFITADNASMLYCSTIPNLTYKCTGFVNSDDEEVLSKMPKMLTNATQTSPVGTYPIEVSGAEAKNYMISYENGTLDILKRRLTASTKDYIRAYGEENPEFEISYSGFVNNEDERVLLSKPQATTTATKRSDVGTYKISVGNGEAQNYEFSYIDGVLTIEKAYQTLSWEQDFSDAKQYDQVELLAEASSGLAITYSIEGDNIGSITKIGTKQYLDCSGAGEAVIVAQQEGDKNYWQTTKMYKSIKIVPTAVQDIINHAYPAKTIYDASGRKLSKLQRGVNVVVMKDGTKKKVVVK